MFFPSITPADASQMLPPVWVFRPTLSNFVSVLSGKTYASQNFGVLLLNSLVVSVCSSLLALAVGIQAAYGLARVRFRGRRSAAMWILSTIMFPPAVSVVPVFI